MPVNRIQRVTSTSDIAFAGVRTRSVPLAYDDAYAELAFKDATGAVRHVGWLQDGVHTENLLRYEYGTLTAAMIKALRATPATLVADVAAGKVVELITLMLFLDAGTEVLAETADNLEVYYNGGTTSALAAAIETTGFIDQAVNQAAIIHGAGIATVAGSVVDGKGLILKNTGDGEFSGNASNDAALRYRVVYRVHPTGW